MVKQICFLWLVLSSFLAYSQPEQLLPEVVQSEPPKRVLFIGNSFSYYNQGIQTHIEALAKMTAKWQPGQHRFRLSTLSGAGMYEHQINHLLLSGKQPWNLVVLQGHSQEPINQYAKAFVDNTRRLSKDIRASGAQPALFMTWAYKDKPEMTLALANAYVALANELKALVVPVGLAFAEANKAHPEVSLYVADVKGLNSAGDITYYKDLKHPSVAGTYLAACVFYSALFGQSAEDNPYTAGLDNEQALKLQRIAWQTVTEFYPTSTD